MTVIVKNIKGKETERMARKYKMKIVRRKWKEAAAWVGLVAFAKVNLPKMRRTNKEHRIGDTEKK
jgi:hypothetical protein